MQLGEALSCIPPLAGIWQELRQGTDVWVRAGSGRESIRQTESERRREHRRRKGKQGVRLRVKLGETDINRVKGKK